MKPSSFKFSSEVGVIWTRNTLMKTYFCRGAGSLLITTVPEMDLRHTFGP